MAPVNLSLRKSRQSANRKKAWRKNANVKDVENYLEDKRIGERIEHVVSKKSNKELFAVDKKHPKKGLKKNERGKLVRNFQITDPSLYAEVPFKPYYRKNTRTQAALDERRQSAIEMNIQMKKYKRKRKAKLPVVSRNLWENEDEPETVLDKKLVDYYKDQIKKLPVKVPKLRFDKVTSLPAVQVPDAGASYNPDIEDYEALVQKAYKVEVKKIEAQARVKETIIDKMSRVPQAEAQKMWLKDMSEGLFEGDEEDEEMEEEDQQKPGVRKKAVKAENRRLRKRRRNELKEKIRVRKNKARWGNLHRENKVFYIKQLEEEIAVEEAKKVQRRQTRLAILKDKEFKPRKLGGSGYEEPDIELNLGEELAGSLRCIQPEGNVQMDRFKSLQRRNIIEPRIRQMVRRRYKKKTFVRKGYRDDEEGTLPPVQVKTAQE